MPRAAHGLPVRAVRVSGVPLHATRAPAGAARALVVVAAAGLVLSGCGEDATGPRRAAAGPRVRAADVVAVRVAEGGEEATGIRLHGGTILTVAHPLPTGARPGGAVVARVGSPPRSARVAVRDDAADLAVLTTTGRQERRDDEAASARSDGTRSGAGWRVLLRRQGRVVARPAVLRRRITALVDAPGSGTGGRRPALELALRAAPGDSGAPVVDGSGRLVGVLFAVSERRGATAYAVTAAPAVAVLRAARRR